MLVLVTAGPLTGCAAPGPSVSQLADEPILVPPMPAIELGRVTRDAQRGWLLGIDSVAVVEAAYAVQLSPDEAERQWVNAFGEQYTLQAQLGRQLLGGTKEVGVSISIGPQPSVVTGQPSDFRPAPAGHTVVTVSVSGLLD